MLVSVDDVAQNSETKKRRRGKGRPFPKGKSGNPGGLPKSVKEIRELALSHAPAALLKLVQLSKCRDKTVACRASEAVLDRAGLRPYSAEPDKLDVTLHEAGDPVAILAARLARRLDAAAAAGAAGDAEPTAG